MAAAAAPLRNGAGRVALRQRRHWLPGRVCPSKKAATSHLPSSSLPRTEALRYLYWGFWFFAVPAVAAWGLIHWLSAHELAGPFDDAARDQSVPAGIVAFTLV